MLGGAGIRRTMLALLVAGLPLVAFYACATNPPASPIVVDDAATFGASACGECVSGACPREQKACEADPTCARYLRCLNACSLDGDGGIVELCAKTCATEAAPSTVRTAWDTCRDRGAGARCTVCGAGNRYQHPLLTQICNDVQIPPLPPQTACDPVQDEIDVTCRKCQYARCCETRKKRDESEAGTALLRECIASTCSDSGARFDVCFAAYPAGVETYAANYGCQIVRCPFECGVTRTPCRTCRNERCGDQEAAFFGNPRALLYTDCTFDCEPQTTECLKACGARYPEAMKLQHDILLCEEARCPGTCPGL